MKNFITTKQKKIGLFVLVFLSVISIVVVSSAVQATTPTVTWNPADGAYNNADANITGDFGAAIYSDSSCDTEMDTAEIAKKVSLKRGSSNGPVQKSTVTYSGTIFTIDPAEDLSDGLYYGVLNSNWYYKDTSSNCLRGVFSISSFIVDTTPPTIDSPIEFEISRKSGSWAKEGDNIITTFSLSEDVDEDSAAALTVVYKIGDGVRQNFAFTQGVSIPTAHCKEVGAAANTFRCEYTVKSTDNGLFQVRIPVLVDRNNNAQETILSTFNTEGITIDTGVPEVDSAKYYESFSEEFNLPSDEIVADTYHKQGKNIFTAVIFSENIEEVVSSGSRARPQISYTVGNSGQRSYTIVSESSSLTSGSCKRLHDDGRGDTANYICMYTVSPGDNGEFTTTVNSINADPAGNTLNDDETADTAIYFDTTAPARPVGLDLADEDDTGRSSSDNLTSTATGLTITGCAEIGSQVQLYSGSETIGGVVTVGEDSNNDCSGTSTGPFTVDIALSEGTHIISATATDSVEQVSSSSAQLRIVVDETAPTLDSVTVTNFGRTETKLMFSEPVFSKVAPDGSDFTFTDSGTTDTITVSNVESAVGETVGLRDTVVLTHSALSADGTITLAYAPSSTADKILGDAAGNTVSSSTEDVSLSGSLEVSLHSDSDSGVKGDNITNFFHRNASFVVTGGGQPFPSSGTVKLYKAGQENRIGQASVSAGTRSVTVSNVSRAHFISNEDSVSIVATFTPAGSTEESAPSRPFVVFYDSTRPVLTEEVPVPPLSNNLTPHYTFGTTEEGTIRYQGSCTSALSTETEGVGSVLIAFDELTEGVYNDCRIFVTDVAGNESFALNVSLFEIDTTPPTAEFSIIRLDGTRTLVTTNEEVYAPRTPQPSDFSLRESGASAVDHIITNIEGLANSAEDADMSFILHHPAANVENTLTISYGQSNDAIFDVAGNPLETISDRRVSVSPFVNITLDPRDDTGAVSNDGKTMFDGDVVSFYATLTGNGSFSTGDTVKLYRGNEATPLAMHTVTLLQNSARRVTLTVPKNKFTPNTAVTLQATLTRTSADEEGGRGAELLIDYDTTAPIVTVLDIDSAPATQKVTSASDNDNEATWRYVKIDGAVSCDEFALTTGSTPYTESEVVTLGTADNGKKVCFSSTDIAGNVGYGQTSVITNIDTGLPVVNTVTLSGNRDFLQVIVEEAVYAVSSPSLGAFTIRKRGSSGGITITAIEELATNPGGATNTFVIRFTGDVSKSDRLTLSYTQDANEGQYIKDTAGNALRSFSSISVKQPPSVELELHSRDDTGDSDSDKITKFDGPEVTLTISTGSDSVFSDRGTVLIYSGDRFETQIASIVIGSEAVDAGGKKTFDHGISATLFVPGENTIAARYRPDGASEAGDLGTPLTITYDNLPPALTEEVPVSSPTNDETPAYIFNSDEAGTIRYNGVGTCEFSTTRAVEGSNTIVSGTLEDGIYDNCVLYVMDIAGNESSSLVITPFTIDTEAPEIEITNPNTEVAMTKVVSAADGDSDETTWMYKIVSSSRCDAAQMRTNPQTYTEGETITLDNEEYNGKRVCFSSADEAGNTDYAISDSIRGIDSSAPGITVHGLSNQEPAQQRVVRATDSDSEPTEWMYIILKGTEQSPAICDEGAFTGNVGTTYTEGTDLPVFDSEDDNGKQVCFSVTDAAENTEYSLSDVITGIDQTAPQISSVRTINADRSETEVIMNEPVYAASTISASNFSLVIDGIEYAATDISGIGRSAGVADNSFIITHPSLVVSDSTVLLKYEKGTQAITDRVGNEMVSIDDVAVSDTKFLSLKLVEEYDTGSSQTDGITNFGDSQVMIMVALNFGTFKTGDTVNIYRGTGKIKTYTISNAFADGIDANGQPSFTASLSRDTFIRNGVTTLRATYTPLREAEGDRGTELTVTHDGSAPDIEVANPSADFAASKVISAIDNDPSDEVVWMYKVINDTDQCDSDAMQSDAESYVEGETIEFNSEDDNGKKVCFSSTDVAGNTDYEASNTVINIDTVAPTIVFATVTNLSRTTTEVTFNEKVYAKTAPATSDFTVMIDGIAQSISGIRDLASSSADAGTSIVITHPSVSEGTSIALNYTRRTGAITDRAGNMLENITASGFTVSNIPFAVITLDPKYDTGDDTTDGITNFGAENAISFTVSLTSGEFKSNDRIEIYSEHNNVRRVIRRVLISSQNRPNSVNAEGQSSFTVSIDKSSFSEGTTTLHASHVPHDSETTGGGSRGADLMITYDVTAPVIEVENPDTDSARNKIVSATDDDGTDTAWTYKVIDGDDECSETEMRSDTDSYTEGDELPPFSSTKDNGKKVCFSATDKAGNTAYQVSEVIGGIDVATPTVSSAVILNVEYTRTSVTFSEPVYASDPAFSASDFKILASGIPHSVISIENLPTAGTDARNTLTLTHPAVSDKASLALSYTRGTHRLVDTAGNELESFGSSQIASTPFVSLDLMDEDDTGFSKTDDITRFDGDEVSIRVSLNTGAVFSENDRIVLYSGTGHSLAPHIVRDIRVSSLLRSGIRARGLSSFVMQIPADTFAENAGTLLSAAYIPVGLSEGERGSEILIIRDTLEPNVVVENPDPSNAARKIVSAIDAETEETEWLYKQIDASVDCDADTMRSDTEEYTEGGELVFEDEDDNNIKICFAVTDAAGNTAYAESKAITGIDTSVPTVSAVEVTGESDITITMNEPVYSVSGPDTDDFIVYVNDVAGYVTGFEGLASTQRSADDKFVIVAEEVFEPGDGITVSYLGSTNDRDSNLIKDAVGKSLQPFERISVTAQRSISFSLNEGYDTGVSSTDSITTLGDDDDVSFTVILNDESGFNNRDKIHIYQDGISNTLKTSTVGVRFDEINVRGSDSATITVPKSSFAEGTVTLYASYEPYRSTSRDILRSNTITLIYDITAPDISIIGNTVKFSAVDTDEEETVWTHKQIAGDADCAAKTMAAETKEYTEGEEVSFENEEDNGTKICFSSTDSAGNTAYEASDEIKGIDVNDPTVSSMKVTSEDEITITMSEPVYSTSGPDISDFVVYSGGAEIYVDAVTGLADTAPSAKDTFVINVAERFGVDEFISVSYLGSSDDIDGELIKDITGRALQPFDEVSATPRDFIFLSLDEEDDTGISATDGITSFGSDSDVSFTIDLAGGGTFRSGDVIRVYRNEEARAVKTVTVRRTQSDDDSFTFTIPKSVFTGGSFTLHALYRPYRGSVGDVLTSEKIELTYDAAAPAVTIVKKKDELVLTATDTDKEETVWMHKQIAGDTDCDAETMAAGAKEYTEGEEIKVSFNSEEDNNTKVCFSSTDAVENTSYKASEVFIDIAAPAITIRKIDNTDSEESKQGAITIAATDTDKEETVWAYKQIAGDTDCNAETMAIDAKEYTEGEEVSFDSEEDNNTKACFSSTDTVENTSYKASEVFVDVAAPIITVTEVESEGLEQDEESTTVTITATDNDEEETTWVYRQISKKTVCNAKAMIVDTTEATNADTKTVKEYTEGEEVSFDSEKDNDTKICFSSTDIEGNTGYGESKVFTDESAPEISITVNTHERFNALSVKAVDDSDDTTVWRYRQIGGLVLCDAAAMKVTKSPYTEDTILVFSSEEDNSTKICFSSGDASGNVSYKASILLTGIDTTSPVITVTDPAIIEGGAREVRATASEEVIFGYAKIGEKVACGLELVPSGIFEPYTSDSPVVLAAEEDAGKKACFAAVDNAGNTAFASSVSVSDIDYTPPTITITKPVAKTALKQPEEAPLPGEESGTRKEEYARVKVISATDSDTTETRWTYKQIDEGAVCNATTMATDTEDYVEGADIEFTSESDNGTKVCFAAHDEFGNVQYAVSEVISGIDAYTPTVSTAVVTGVDRNRTEITMTEPVYAPTLPSPQDFAIVIDGASYAVTSVSGLARSADEASENFVITHPSVGNEVAMSLKYTTGTHNIVDLAGNALESFEDHPIVDTQSVRLSLEETDDDGSVVFDRDGNTSVVLSLTGRSFSNGDTVRLYERGEIDSFMSILISNGIRGAVDADGESAFTISLPAQRFSEEKTVLYAVYVPAGSGKGERGHDLVVTRDLTGPTITVRPIQSGAAKSKVVRANDDDTSETVWTYRMASGDIACDAEFMNSKTRSYREGSGLVFSKERANGYRVCFSSTDEAGNTTYAASDVISGIDSTLPTITITGPQTGKASSKEIRVTANSKESLTWMYRQIAEESLCDADTMSSGAKKYKEGRTLEFSSESDNGTIVCFSLTDNVGNMSYVTSDVIEGIDTVAPQITVTNPPSGASTQKVIRAIDADPASETTWKYKVIKETSICDERQMSSRTTAYQEDSGLVFRRKQANGYKICFSSTDKAGNSSYAESTVMRGIGSGSVAASLRGTSGSSSSSGSTTGATDTGTTTSGESTGTSSPVTSLITSDLSLITIR